MSYPKLVSVEVTIPINTALANAIDLEGQILAGIRMPAAWTAADISFLAGPAADDLMDVHSSTAEIAITATVDLHIILDRDLLRGAGRFLQIRSGVSAAPVNQVAKRTLELLLSNPS